MTMQELGSLGEILRVIAVLATLVYLAVQTRDTRVAFETAGNAMTVEAHEGCATTSPRCESRR